MHKESKNSSIFQSWSKSVASEGTSGQQWSIHTLVLFLMQKTQVLAVTGLQPVVSASSQIPWSAPAIPPSPFSRHNLLWETLTRWKAKLYLKQQGVQRYSTDLLTEKLICRRLPSPPAQLEINFVWALLRSEFQVHSYIPSTKEAEECELRQCSPSQDPVMPGDLQIQNTDSANHRKIML